MSDYHIRVTRLTVLPPKEPIFSEQATHITIRDDAAGEFLEIEQQSGHIEAQGQKILITADEWPAIKSAVEQLLEEISKNVEVTGDPLKENQI